MESLQQSGELISAEDFRRTYIQDGESGPQIVLVQEIFGYSVEETKNRLTECLSHSGFSVRIDDQHIPFPQNGGRKLTLVDSDRYTELLSLDGTIGVFCVYFKPNTATPAVD